MIEYIPYFCAAMMLLLAFSVMIRTRHPLIGVVVCLIPLFTLTVDFFVDGNQTMFRAYMSIVYSFALILAIVYYLRKDNR